ncbi:MAG: hypothetical protein ABSH38_05700 [Verrucomicrobiota bacterium]|jgi:hypothetical protein
MLQWLSIFLTNAVPSIVVGVCTAIISVRLALRRYRAERWWERKAEAYSRIVDALHALVEYCSTMADVEQGVRYSEERQKELGDECHRAYLELRKATGIGAYIVSDEVAAVLATLEARPRLDPDGGRTSMFEIMYSDFEAYKRALLEIRSLAKKDLGVK